MIHNHRASVFVASLYSLYLYLYSPVYCHNQFFWFWFCQSRPWGHTARHVTMQQLAIVAQEHPASPITLHSPLCAAPWEDERGEKSIITLHDADLLFPVAPGNQLSVTRDWRMKGFMCLLSGGSARLWAFMATRGQITSAGRPWCPTFNYPVLTFESGSESVTWPCCKGFCCLSVPIQTYS